ncbi:MAG TPA: DUF2892 domain-containing protein [Arenimonas sp.]|nr:DUF2892 domain-containing protein [Arenimonas sp.]
MKTNVGKLDRIFRMVLGLSLLTWGFINQNWLGAVGIIPLFTAFFSWCPAYIPFGISTCKSK